MLHCSHFVTGFGTGTVYASDQGVVSVEIPDMSRHETAQLSSISPEYEPSEISDLAAGLLLRYFNGERVDFNDIPVVLGGMTPFRQNVLKVIRNLAFGEICSYGMVAEECGSPRAARAVGGALAANPVPVIIPCHRVVASNGLLTGFSAPGGESTKRALLEMEGVEFKGLLVVTKQLVINRLSLR